MNLFVRFWLCYSCFAQLRIILAKNITAFIDIQADYENVTVSVEDGRLGGLFTHSVSDPNDTFTGVGLSRKSSKLENIVPTQEIAVYAFRHSVRLFKLFNKDYAEGDNSMRPKYFYYMVGKGSIETCTYDYYYRMVVTFYSPPKYIELSIPSCHFIKTVKDADEIVYDIVGTIFAAEVHSENRFVWQNRGSQYNRLCRIRRYAAHKIPFIDIQSVTPLDKIFIVTCVWYMHGWIGLTELQLKLNDIYDNDGQVLQQVPLYFFTRNKVPSGTLINATGVIVNSPIKLTIDLADIREDTKLITIETFTDMYGEVNLFICDIVCVFSEVFFRGSRVFESGEHSPFLLSLQQGLPHNVVYALVFKPEGTELWEYVQVVDIWSLEIVVDPDRYFYLLVLDPTKEPDRRLYLKEYKRDGKAYMHTYTARKLIGFIAVLVEEDGVIIERSIENAIICEVRMRPNIRKYIFYLNGIKMMIIDRFGVNGEWTRGILARIIETRETATTSK